MEVIILTLVFTLPLVIHVALHSRAGLRHDALWSKHQTVTGHGMCLGLPIHRPAAIQPSIALAPPRNDWRAPGM
jgi:hypothetical protein